MALNLLKVLDHIRVTNPLEDDHIETLMNLATNEVERIASGAPGKCERSIFFVVDCVELFSKGRRNSSSPQFLAEVWRIVTLKPWRKFRAGRIQESSE